MRVLLRVYRLINVLSIDVALGSAFSALFFGDILNVNILPYGLLALALTVWIIYTADHLRDARNIGKKASSDRHYFHQRNFKTLSACLLIAIVADIVLLFFIRKPVFVGGLFLAVLVAFYLVLQGRMYYLKELVVALLYTLGVLLPSLAVTENHISVMHVGLFVQFFLIAFLNLLIFSFFDADNDRQDNLSSFVTRFGKSAAKNLISGLFMILILINLIQLFTGGYDRIPFLILLVMALVLLGIFSFSRFFRQSEFYRMLGDAVFFLPILIRLS
jgi:hypothetical protein